MKKIFKYLGVLLSVALMGAFTACTVKENEESADLGLGIKVFFPTKVVAGQPMTINGSGFSDVREIVFPDGVSVSSFELVSSEMIRVTAPSGISAEGGKLIVRTADEQAESRLPLTLGRTVISGYSKQDGEEIQGGDQLTIYGEDLEFIYSVELLDPDGEPLVVTDDGFYRKGTNTVIITIPKKVFEGTYVGKLTTIDGRVFNLPELSYKPASEGGHWEIVKTSVWTNDDPAGHGPANWNGTYRFSSADAATTEEIYAFPMDVWNSLKTNTFYVLLEGENPQIRVTTGWWSVNLTPDDITPGNELLADNGDGTWTLTVSLDGTALVNSIDVEHLLFTGSGFTPLDIYFEEEIWVDGGGHWETVNTPVWTNDDPAGHGLANWNGTYRFSSADASTGEEIYAIPMDMWEKMKAETFYVLLEGESPQIRVTTGWWSVNLTSDDITPGNELLADNGDGTWTLTVSLDGTALVNSIDVEHLLFTGSGFTPLSIFFSEEVWVDGGESEPKEVDIWTNDDPAGHGPANWNGTYRFSSADASTGEEIYAIPMDIWGKIKTDTFYVLLDGASPQIRVTTGWWSVNLTTDDITPGNELLADNGDGTWTLTVSLVDSALVNSIDVEHLLFTGSGFTPLKLYFLEK